MTQNFNGPEPDRPKHFTDLTHREKMALKKARRDRWTELAAQVRANGTSFPPIDSKSGMTMLAKWAKAHDVVLTEAHEAMAHKHGVSLEGIKISRPIPVE